jgi:hypothetical protein
MTTSKSILLCAALASVLVRADAASVSTGDLGYNVVTASGSYTWSPTVSAPSNTLPATLEVVYGLWNDPGMVVHAFVNGTEAGSFLVNAGYLDPGPSSNSFNVSGLLVDGVNTITFGALDATEGEYVINRVDLQYNLPSTNNTEVPPGTNGLVVNAGSSVLHYMTTTPLPATGVAPDVTALLRLQFKKQGRSLLQKFDLTVTSLEPNTEYALVAAAGEETTLSPVATFRSDKQGQARVFYMKQGEGQGSGKKSLPSALDPLTDVRTVGLQDGALQVVALGSINASPNFQYLVKRNLTPADMNGTPQGSIRLKANAEGTSFRLLADGLAGGSVYHLALNSGIVETLAADAAGRVQLLTWPATAPAVLDLRSLELLDESSHVILSTTLPK